MVRDRLVDELPELRTGAESILTASPCRGLQRMNPGDCRIRVPKATALERFRGLAGIAQTTSLAFSESFRYIGESFR
jgi:hypothetical protein